MPIRSSILSTAGRGRLFDSVIDTVGDTPTIRINNLGVAGRTIYAKAEFFNPAASVKDRLALNIIEEGERSGALKPGQTVVEATSGNTGIGLAMVCAQKGYPLVVTMADSFSVERRKLMRMLGAKVVLTPRALKGFGMYQKAVELAEANGWFLAHQFETKANADIHEATTAREIIGDFAGKRLDVFVTGYGTGGTVVGVGRVLRRERPNVRIVLSEPANASLVSDGRPQARNPDGSPASSHPAWESHPIQGWTPGLHSARAAGGDRRQALRRGPSDFRRRRNQMGEGTGAKGRHFHRRVGRVDLWGRPTGRRIRARRLGYPLHAARHRRALSDDAALRGHRRRDERRGTRAFTVDAVGAVSAGMTALRSSQAPNRRLAPKALILRIGTRRLRSRA